MMPHPAVVRTYSWQFSNTYMVSRMKLILVMCKESAYLCLASADFYIKKSFCRASEVAQVVGRVLALHEIT